MHYKIIFQHNFALHLGHIHLHSFYTVTRLLYSAERAQHEPTHAQHDTKSHMRRTPYNGACAASTTLNGACAAYLEVVVQVVGEHAEEELPVVVVDEAVVEDARRLVRVQQRAVVRVVDHCLVGLHQAANHLQQPQACSKAGIQFSAEVSKRVGTCERSLQLKV